MAMATLIGQRLGQYEIVTRLGQGGMATVYGARQPSMNRDVAIKVIRHDLADVQDFIQRFEREVQISGKLRHPHILKVFDYGQEGSIVYLVMEYIPGGSLADLLHSGPLMSELVIRLLEQMASALDYAHQLGIVHRDLKPQNVLVDQQGNAFISDFGIARTMGRSAKLVEPSITEGTPTYIPPEEWRGQPPDVRSDVYALGVLVYEMLTGHVPFSAESTAALMQQHLNADPPSVRDVRPELPHYVDSVLAKALAKDPNQRYQSAGRLAAAIKLSLGTPVRDPASLVSAEFAPVSGLSSTRRPYRVLLLNGAAAGALALLLGVGGYGLISSHGAAEADANLSTAALRPAAVEVGTEDSPTPTSTETSTLTDTPTETQTATPTETPTDTATSTLTPTLTATYTRTRRPVRLNAPVPTPTMVPAAPNNPPPQQPNNMPHTKAQPTRVHATAVPPAREQPTDPPKPTKQPESKGLSQPDNPPQQNNSGPGGGKSGKKGKH
jgi:serine/threonine protein kinase